MTPRSAPISTGCRGRPAGADAPVACGRRRGSYSRPTLRSRRILSACLALSLVLSAAAAQPESNRRMVEHLRELTAGGDPTRSPFDFSARARQLGARLAGAGETERMQQALPHANLLLHAGDTEAAIARYEEFERFVRSGGITLPSPLATELRTFLALSYLRLGERENCLRHHNADSCLFPLRGGGIHQEQRGSRGALAPLRAQLEAFPGDLRARWLLNLAHMTLGEYPAGVPERWLIDPRHFASDYDIKRFPDAAGRLGLDVDDVAGGVVMEDFDRDGFLDLMVSAQGLHSQLRYFRSNGDGTFTQLTESAGLTGLFGGLNLIHTDYDNDGYADVLVLRGGWLGREGRYPVSLLRNNHDNTFTDVTERAGLLRRQPTQAAVWLDYDNDGWIDLYLGSESEGDVTVPCALFRNQGDGTFVDVAAESGVAVVGYVKAVVSADYNNDGRPDLYVSRRDGANHLFRNDGPAAGTGAGRPAAWRFTDVAREAGVTEPFRSFSAWFFDYDNDGWSDLFVNGYYLQDVGDVAADVLHLPHAAERARLYRNRGDGTFADVSRDAGVYQLLHTMGCNFGDLDNDGWLDFYVGTGDPEFSMLIPNRMFRNDGGRRFQDVTTSGGFGQLQKGHGIAFGDLDNDGDQDIYSVVGGAIVTDNYRNQLFANPGHGHHWLKLELQGRTSNRAAVGARVQVTLQTPAGERTLHRTVGTGGSFGSAPLRVELGLGDADRVLRVEILWPATGRRQVLTGLEPDRAYRVQEDATTAEPVVLRRFDLATAGREPTGHHHHP
jgi:hypothetical protein